jgi:PLP dependent protein
MDTIAERTRLLLAEIERQGQRYSRPSGSVTLIGIGKTHPAERIRAAHQGGLRHAGESYLQEALPKIAELAGLGLTWHFVGRIQANKTAAIAGAFDWVHGIDRLRIAQRLNEQRPLELGPLDCCIEVNLGAEQSKGGVMPEQLPALAEAISKLQRLRLRGLMVLPEPVTDPLRQRQPFARLRQLLEQMRPLYPGLDTLSMGMSQDMESAIAEGATMVRIGTALFGERDSRSPQQSGESE